MSWWSVQPGSFCTKLPLEDTPTPAVLPSHTHRAGDSVFFHQEPRGSFYKTASKLVIFFFQARASFPGPAGQ